MKIPNLVKNTSLYSFATFLQKGVGFFLMPLYTAYLTPEDYGTFNLINAVIGFLGILILFSLHNAATRFHYQYKDDKGKAKVWGTLLIMVLANSIIWGILFIVFHKYLVDPFTGDIPFWKLTFISLLCVMISPVYTFYQQWLQTIEDGKRYTFNTLLNWLLLTILNIVTIVFFGWGVFGMILSTFIVSLLFFIYSIKEFVPKVDFNFDKKLAKDAIKYSLPLAPHTVSGYFSVFADRVLLNRLASLSQLGLYSVANQFGVIMNSITMSLNQAFTPWFYREVNKDNFDNNKLNVMVETSVIVYCFIALIIALFSPEVVRLMTSKPEYHTAWQPISFLIFGYVLNGVYFFFSKALFYYKPQYVFIISISQLACNLLFNLLFIPELGGIGAGLAFLLSQLESTIISLVLTKKFCAQIKFQWYKIYAITLLFLFASFSVFIIELKLSLLIGFFVKILEGSLIIILIYLVRGKAIINLIKNRKL